MYIDLEVLAINGKGGKPFVTLLIFTYYDLHTTYIFSECTNKCGFNSSNVDSKESMNPAHSLKQQTRRQERNKVVVSIYSFIYYGIAPIPIFIMVLHLRSSHYPSSYTFSVTAGFITAMNISQTFKELHNCSKQQS